MRLPVAFWTLVRKPTGFSRWYFSSYFAANFGEVALSGTGRSFGLQDLHHLVGGGVLCILLEIPGNGENCVAHTDLSYAIRAAGGAGSAGLIIHRRLLSIFLKYGLKNIGKVGMYWPMLRTDRKALIHKAFKFLNVHACGALARLRPSSSGARWRRTQRSISPGWSAARTSLRTRHRAAPDPGGTERRTAPCRLAERQRGTICI